MLLLGRVDPSGISRLLQRYGLILRRIEADTPIPGSYWGGAEAGLRANRLYARADTPLHSVLHESCHFICMEGTRRTHLERDAGGDDLEECAVCYLQVLLADELPELGRERMFRDMDDWGYSFRLGSSCAWFHEDAEDARQWLTGHGLIDAHGRPTGSVRGA